MAAELIYDPGRGPELVGTRITVYNFTDNRNSDGPDSRQATLTVSWRLGQLPVLTLSNRDKFKRDRGYAERLAADVAELLFGMALGQDRDQPRIYVPFRANESVVATFGS